MTPPSPPRGAAATQTGIVRSSYVTTGLGQVLLSLVRLACLGRTVLLAVDPASLHDLLVTVPVNVLIVVLVTVLYPVLPAAIPVTDSRIALPVSRGPRILGGLLGMPVVEMVAALAVLCAGAWYADGTVAAVIAVGTGLGVLVVLQAWTVILVTWRSHHWDGARGRRTTPLLFVGLAVLYAAFYSLGIVEGSFFGQAGLLAAVFFGMNEVGEIAAARAVVTELLLPGVASANIRRRLWASSGVAAACAFVAAMGEGGVAPTVAALCALSVGAGVCVTVTLTWWLVGVQSFLSTLISVVTGAVLADTGIIALTRESWAPRRTAVIAVVIGAGLLAVLLMRFLGDRRVARRAGFA